jgi:hypothetical protein
MECSFSGGRAALAAVFVAGMVWPAAASSFDEAMDVRETGNASSQQSQKVIDKVADTSDQLLTQYRQVLTQLDAVRVYNKQLNQLIDSQNEEITKLLGEIDDVELVGRQITPHMLKMIEGIDAFVQLDVPFLLEERTTRVAKLRKLMINANVTDAEKYRTIMEAYQIENEFGRTIEAYRGALQIGGEDREVDFLRIGRVALLYQSFDGMANGSWDDKSKSWLVLDRSHTQSIKEGLRMARKQAAPSLILVPVAAAEAN